MKSIARKFVIISFQKIMILILDIYLLIRTIKSVKLLCLINFCIEFPYNSKYFLLLLFFAQFSLFFKKRNQKNK